MIKSKPFEHSFLLLLLAGTSIIAVLVFLPYLTTIALAVTFAIVLQPVQTRFERLFKGSRGIASLATLLVTAIMIMIPMSLIGIQVFNEARDVYTEISTNRDNYFSLITTTVNGYVRPFFPQFNLELTDALKQGATFLANNLGSIFSGTAQTVLQLILGSVALFYLLRDGELFKQGVMDLSPLADKYDQSIIHRLESSVNSVMKGSLLIAIIQGIFTGIGLWMFGVPNPALWGSAAAICALVPGVGTSIIVIPAIAYLFIAGKTGPGIGMLLWGMLAVGTIDNFLGPMFVSRGTQIHPLLILFSVIGGISFFGPFGFILGPLSLSLLVALLEIWKIVSRKTT